MALLQCQMCEVRRRTIAEILSHYRKVHVNDNRFFLECEIPGCHATFTKCNSYNSHLRRQHKDFPLDEPLPDVNGLEDPPQNPVELPPPVEEDVDFADVQARSAEHLLRMKSSEGLTEKSVDNLVCGYNQFVKNTIDNLKTSVDNALRNSGINSDEIPGLDACFNHESEISNPFAGLETRTQRTNYFEENFELLRPRRVVIGNSTVMRRRGNKRFQKLKDDEVIYVPLLESLQRLLNNKTVLNEIMNPHQKDDDTIADFCDGEYFKSHPLFSVDIHALQLILYYDEFEVANPLGTKTGKHKLGVLYYTLGNIRPEYRSQLKAIQLLCIAENPVILKYGMDSFLRPFMDDLRELEKDGGHQFKVGNQDKSFAGTIAFLSADNLGSQQAGGFKEGSGTERRCRQCLGTKEETTMFFQESDFQLRTIEGHNDQCDDVERDSEYGKEYGINRTSILNESRYFHVIGGLPGDIMHDVLEGLLPYEIKEMLKIFILEYKLFTLEELNVRMLTFDYGYYNESNKPSPIKRIHVTSKKKGIKQKAAQMWCLGVFLPLLIGDCIDENDEHWQLLLQLLAVMDILFAPVIGKNDAVYSMNLIDEHHEEFRRLYPGRSIIPKMHYVVHYPSHIQSLGPMVRSWTMRFEGKHNFFKKLAQKIGNFTNLPLSMAERHQEAMCSELRTDYSAGGVFLKKPMEILEGDIFCAVESRYFNELKQKQPDITEDTKIQESTRISVMGTEYRIGAVVHIGTEELLPVFGEIVSFLVKERDNDNVFFILRLCHTVAYCSHYHAFEVVKEFQPSHIAVNHSDLKMYLPLHFIFKADLDLRKRIFIAPRHQLVE